MLFLGTPVFAVPSLRALFHSRHQILAVLTQPDRPRGRRMRRSPPPVKPLANEMGLCVMQPEKPNSPSALQDIRHLSPDAAVVVAYGQILKTEFLGLPRFGCVNVHPSLLPRYRGPTPIQSAIMAGERQTGVTTMLLDEGVDSGDILLQESVEISMDDTTGSLHDKLAEKGAELVVRTLDELESGELIPSPQDEADATFTKKIEKQDTRIDWSREPREIHNHVRAMDPAPGCRTFLRGELLKIWKVKPCGTPPGAGQPGEILSTANERLLVRAGSGVIEIQEMQLSGGKKMSASEFLRGHRLGAGDRFGAKDRGGNLHA